jgi:hypothetical protein
MHVTHVDGSPCEQFLSNTGSLTRFPPIDLLICSHGRILS